METLHHFVADAIRAMATIDGLGGEIIASARNNLPRVEAERIMAAVWTLKAVLARAHVEDPLGHINAIDGRLTAAQEHT